MRFFDSTTQAPMSAPTPQSQTSSCTELKTYEQALAIARTVASYPKGRHELVLGPTLIDTFLPETQAVAQSRTPAGG